MAEVIPLGERFLRAMRAAREKEQKPLSSEMRRQMALADALRRHAELAPVRAMVQRFPDKLRPLAMDVLLAKDDNARVQAMEELVIAAGARIRGRSRPRGPRADETKAKLAKLSYQLQRLRHPDEQRKLALYVAEKESGLKRTRITDLRRAQNWEAELRRLLGGDVR